MHGILEFLSSTMLSADLATELTLWFSWIPIWFSIQQNITFLVWLMKFRMFRSLIIRGLSTSLFLTDESIEKESERMMNLFELLVETMLSASSITEILAVNLAEIFGSFFWKVIFGCFIVEYFCICSSFGVFGAICINEFFLDVGEFFLIH